LCREEEGTKGWRFWKLAAFEILGINETIPKHLPFIAKAQDI